MILGSLFFYPTSSCSNSSNDLPLVSGQRFQRKIKAERQIALYIQKVPLLPKAVFIDGNENVSVQQPTQRANVQVAIATPRMLLGNISASSVHVTGPNVIA